MTRFPQTRVSLARLFLLLAIVSLRKIEAYQAGLATRSIYRAFETLQELERKQKGSKP